MTDPLTVKELIQKSYEYIDKLTKECAKSLLEEYNKSHKKFQIGNLPKETSANIIQWFEKREKNVRINLIQNSIVQPAPAQFRMKLNGNTKDADFILDATVGTFVIPGTEISEQTTCFVKTLVINAEKANFVKRRI